MDMEYFLIALVYDASSQKSRLLAIFHLDGHLGARTLVRMNSDAFTRMHSYELTIYTHANAKVMTVRDVFCYGRPM